MKCYSVWHFVKFSFLFFLAFPTFLFLRFWIQISNWTTMRFEGASRFDFFFFFSFSTFEDFGKTFFLLSMCNCRNERKEKQKEKNLSKVNGKFPRFMNFKLAIYSLKLHYIEILDLTNLQFSFFQHNMRL